MIESLFIQNGSVDLIGGFDHCEIHNCVVNVYPDEAYSARYCLFKNCTFKFHTEKPSTYAYEYAVFYSNIMWSGSSIS